MNFYHKELSSIERLWF